MEELIARSLWIAAGAILLLIVANGFFAASEIALISTRRSRILQLSQEGDARAKTKEIGLRRRHVIVEAPEIIPGQKDGRRIPSRPLHDGVHQRHRPILAVAGTGRWMLTSVAPDRREYARGDPTHGRKLAILRVDEKLRAIHDMLGPQRSVANVIDGVKRRPNVGPFALGGGVVLPGYA